MCLNLYSQYLLILSTEFIASQFCMHCSAVHFFMTGILYISISMFTFCSWFETMLFFHFNICCHNLKKLSWFQFRNQDLEFKSAKSKSSLKICNQTQRSTQYWDEKDALIQQLWLTTESDRTPTLNIKVEDEELQSDYGAHCFTAIINAVLMWRGQSSVIQSHPKHSLSTQRCFCSHCLLHSVDPNDI